MFLENNKAYILNKIQTDIGFVEDFISGKNPISNYLKTYNVTKKNGQTRKIHSITNSQLRDVYKKLYEELVAYRGAIHSSAHGFIRGRSIVTNAKQHLGKKYLLHLDIDDFFGSIKSGKVYDSFIRLGADKSVAEMLTKLCVVDGRLPQGPQTSPDISNHCFFETDQKLESYAKDNKLTYTRYVDDITFSSDENMNVKEIEKIINDYDFSLQKSKTKTQKRGSNQYVTGLTVFDEESPRVSKRYKKNLRLRIHLLKTMGLENYVIDIFKLGPPPRHDDDMLAGWHSQLEFHCIGTYLTINGQICFINGVEPVKAKKFWNEFKKIDASIVPEHYRNR